MSRTSVPKIRSLQGGWSPLRRVAFLEVGRGSTAAAAVARALADEHRATLINLRFSDLAVGVLADLVVAPAGVDEHDRPACARSEIATAAVLLTARPALRVTRRPLAVTNVVLFTSNTAGCGMLLRRYMELQLWPEARLSILPFGDYRTSVQQNLAQQLTDAKAIGQPLKVLPSVDLDFEVLDLAGSLEPFQVAVIAQPAPRSGWFDAARNDPIEAVKSFVPMSMIFP